MAGFACSMTCDNADCVLSECEVPTARSDGVQASPSLVSMVLSSEQAPIQKVSLFTASTSSDKTGELHATEILPPTRSRLEDNCDMRFCANT